MSELTCVCPFCAQQIKCDSSQSGSIMTCPACSRQLMVVEADSLSASQGQSAAIQNAPVQKPGTGIRTPPIASSPGRAPAPVPEQQQPGPKRKFPAKVALGVAVAALAAAGAAGYFFFLAPTTSGLSPNADEVLHLSFDNVNNGAVLNSGTGGSAMDGTLIGDVSLAAGKFGKALKLNGRGGQSASDIVLVRDKGVNTDADGSWTVAFWIKTTTANAAILYQGDGTWNDGCTTFYLNNGDSNPGGTRAGGVRYGGLWLTGTAPLNDGRWHHVALVDDRGTETIYVDGTQDFVTSKMMHSLNSTANQVWIGGSPDPTDSVARMIGMIDEVWMFERALAPVEVQSLMKHNSITN